VSEFSHGGRGGNNSASEDGKNFGDGGTGGGMVGGSGHDGIVIIRFPHPGNTAPVEDAAID
jgi:hypothetical protein